MTAKSRRHKLDKRRKSDEHPQPRRHEEDGGRPEGTRSRTGLIPRKREGQPAADEGTWSPEYVTEDFTEDEFAEVFGEEALDKVRTIRSGRLLSVSLVPEGQGFPGSYVELLGNKEDYVVPDDLQNVLTKVEEGDYFFAQGWYGKVLWVTDQEKAVFDEAQRQYEEGVRTSDTSDTATDG